MKKSIIFILLFFFAFLFISCDAGSEIKTETCEENPNQDKCKTNIESCEENPNQDKCDTIAPIISYNGSTDSSLVTILIHSEYDIMDGIKAEDNLEGDITSRIEVYNLENLDLNKVGTYEIQYLVCDKQGNMSNLYKKEIKVVESINPDEGESMSDILNYPLYTGKLSSDASPQSQKCFGGAWYHKVNSNSAEWNGIEATVVLPSFDINRYKTSYNDSYFADPYSKNLDNPSIYLGGHASTESDVGLSLSLVTMNGTISTGSVAYRPFWRYIVLDASLNDVGGYETHNGDYSVSCVGNNCNSNWHYSKTEYYYLPGDKVRMIVYSPKENYLQLIIELIEVSTIKESQEIRAKYGWKDPETFYSPIFNSPGHGMGNKVTFKRVNAIDQSNNEGGTAIDTTTKVENAIWESTYLYRNVNGTMYKVPMNSTRSSSISCPNANAFVITEHNSSNGGEIVTIQPSAISKSKVIYKKED